MRSIPYLLPPKFRKYLKFNLEGGNVPVHCIPYGPLKQPQNFFLGS